MKITDVRDKKPSPKKVLKGDKSVFLESQYLQKCRPLSPLKHHSEAIYKAITTK